MTREMENTLLDLKDQLLEAIHQVDELMCGWQVVVHHHEQGDDDPDELDPDDEEREEPGVTGIVDPANAGRKKQKPIQYNLAPRRRDVAFKEHP